MTWTVLQTKRCSRQYKKLHSNTAADVVYAINEVEQNSESGERKKGDLTTLRVFKFRSAEQLGYTLDDTVRLIYLEAIGPHENVYRGLKRE